MPIKASTAANIRSQLAQRLLIPGEITTAEAWKICSSPYSTLTQVFKAIMAEMVLQGRAIKIRNGRYRIVAPANNSVQNRLKVC